MNNIRNNIIMDIKHLVRYKEFLFNKKHAPATRKSQADFCSICCGDDCVCFNSFSRFSRYSSFSSFSHNKLLNNKNLVLCSKYCSENVFKDCICL